MDGYDATENPDGTWTVYYNGNPLKVCSSELEAEAYIVELIEADDENESES